ncbi:MAG: hypothetical protein LBR47_01825 [Spirochaetaceae bacterium]|jgi:transcriptional regulator GlxA family with amidase domain|nr:hypothetical protein [Spirochaetaceae bacterium]
MNIRCFLFDGFETLDLFGPAEIFGQAAEYRLNYISAGGGSVTSAQGVRIETDPLSSGVSAGIDMALGFIADRHGRSRAAEIAAHIEYIWNSDMDRDPFAGGN